MVSWAIQPQISQVRDEVCYLPTVNALTLTQNIELENKQKIEKKEREKKRKGKGEGNKEKMLNSIKIFEPVAQ